MADPSAPRPRASSPAPWWRGATIYQIYPRSFLDTTGSGIGDLNGITQRLEYIADLGVDAIWICPFYASPMHDFGYDVADYRAVDPMFGTMADIDALVARAHDLGLKVIVDQVLSHTSIEHAWFDESRQSRNGPKADWYVWQDPKADGSPPNNWQSVFGGPAWEWDARRKQYYLHNFLREQPDLNVHNEDVQAALIDVVRFWLDRGVDGFRLDALNFAMHDPALRDNPPSHAEMEDVTRPFDMQQHTYNQSHETIPAFLERLRPIFDQYPDIFTVAEVVGPSPLAEMKAFTEGVGRLHSAYNFDFLYAPTLTPQRVIDSLAQWTDADDEGWPSWAFSNHDAPRAVSRWAAPDDADRAAPLLIMLLLSLRGNAILYQGEELGLPQADVPFEALRDPEAIANWPHTLGRDGARTPMAWDAEAPNAGFSSEMPWLPAAPRHVPLSMNQQMGRDDSCLEIARQLLAIRKNNPCLKTGAQRVLAASDTLLAFTREASKGEREDTKAHAVACVFNLSATSIDLPPGLIHGTIIKSVNVAPTPTTIPASLPPYAGLWVQAETR